MMLPHSYSAPVPARETEPEAPTEPAPRPEPAPWVSPRVLILLGLAVLGIAYAQREARNAPPRPSYFMKTDAWACPNAGDLRDALRLGLERAAVQARLIHAGCRIFPAGSWVAFAYLDGALARVRRDGGFWVLARDIGERQP